jgi:hypothetical protein
MIDSPAGGLSLRPEHLSVLASASGGVAGALISRGGRRQQTGVERLGRFEFLANCGLVEFLERVESARRDGEVWIYYALTERGRILLRWLAGPQSAVAA